MQRKIIHLDMDAFFAAIEERDNPELKGKPVIVGAMPGTRGVVSTCNYEARKYGVYSAMSIAEAYRRCPKGIYIRPQFQKYAEASQQVHRLMASYTDILEYISLDEGYMDVTGSELLFGSPEHIAQTLQRQVFETVGTTCSVGVGYCMMAAKTASEEKKPGGFFVIPSPEAFRLLMKKRPVGALFGVGKKTEERLRCMGLYTVGQLAEAPPARLQVFGTMGAEMQAHARGIDNRPVTPGAPPKSIGKETTFMRDVSDFELLKNTLVLLAGEVSYRLKTKKLWCRTVTLKVKYYDMQSITRSSSGNFINRTEDLYQAAAMLLRQVRRDKPVRLVGISASNLTDSGYEQLAFSFEHPAEFEEKNKKEEKLDAVVMTLRQTYGKGAVKTAKQIAAEHRLEQECREYHLEPGETKSPSEE